MGTKNSTLIIAPSLNQYDTTFKQMIFANEPINLYGKQHQEYDQKKKRKFQKETFEHQNLIYLLAIINLRRKKNRKKIQRKKISI